MTDLYPHTFLGLPYGVLFVVQISYYLTHLTANESRSKLSGKAREVSRVLLASVSVL